MKKSNVVVIGIGNMLMGDDGVGPTVINLLRKRMSDIEFVELDTAGYGILSYIEGKEKVIIIDAAYFGGFPGEIKRVSRHQLKSTRKGSSLNLHGIDVLSVLDYAAQIGIEPEQVILFCIQAKHIVPCQGLAKEVEKAAVEVAATIEKELATSD